MRRDVTLMLHNVPIGMAELLIETMSKRMAGRARFGGRIGGEMNQLTQAQAIELYDSGVWAEWSDRDKALFQLQQEYLFMPFVVFHKAVEKVLGRSVWTHEFINGKGLLAEALGDAEPPAFDDIMRMLPPEKTIVVLGDPHA